MRLLSLFFACALASAATLSAWGVEVPDEVFFYGYVREGVTRDAVLVELVGPSGDRVVLVPEGWFYRCRVIGRSSDGLSVAAYTLLNIQSSDDLLMNIFHEDDQTWYADTHDVPGGVVVRVSGPDTGTVEWSALCSVSNFPLEWGQVQ